MQGGSQHQAPYPNSRTVPVLGGGAGQETAGVCVRPPMSLRSGVGSPSSQPMAGAGQGYTLKQCSDQTNTEIPFEPTQAVSWGVPREATYSSRESWAGFWICLLRAQRLEPFIAHSKPSGHSLLPPCFLPSGLFLSTQKAGNPTDSPTGDN